MTKIYIHPRLGEITIKRVSLSRRVKLAVHPLRGINVTIPWLVSYSRAIEFINEKESWISATLIKQSKTKAGGGNKDRTRKSSEDYWEGDIL